MPSSRARRPTVAIVSARGTLTGIDAPLRRAGLRVVRLRSVEPRPVSPKRWLGRALQTTHPDTVVITSRAAVAAGLEPWRRAVPTLASTVEYWAAGPGTAHALRSAGVGHIRRPRGIGSDAVVSALGAVPRRTVVYFRSDRAGPELARRLRRRGHRVVDRVVYRLGSVRPWTTAEKAGLLRATLVVVTSPSGIQELQRQLDGGDLHRLTRQARLTVLGPRSRQTAIGLGFRHVSVAPSTTGQRFTQHLLQELRHATS